MHFNTILVTSALAALATSLPSVRRDSPVGTVSDQANGYGSPQSIYQTARGKCNDLSSRPYYAEILVGSKCAFY
jgi:hypothetical protein